MRFKIGDRVKVTKAYYVGKMGTVVNCTAHPEPMWAVQVDGKTYENERVGTLFNWSELELVD